MRKEKEAKVKQVKEVIVSFRLTEPQSDALMKAFEKKKKKMLGVKSRNTLARRLAIDFSMDILHYRSDKDMLLGTEIV